MQKKEIEFYVEFYTATMTHVMQTGDQKLWEQLIPVLVKHKKNIMDIVPVFAQFLNSMEDEHE